MTMMPEIEQLQLAQEAVIEHVKEHFKDMQEVALSMHENFLTDASNLDELILNEKRRLAINRAKMQEARVLFAQFTEQFEGAIASPDREHEEAQLS